MQPNTDHCFTQHPLITIAPAISPTGLNIYAMLMACYSISLSSLKYVLIYTGLLLKLTKWQLSAFTKRANQEEMSGCKVCGECCQINWQKKALVIGQGMICYACFKTAMLLVAICWIAYSSLLFAWNSMYLKIMYSCLKSTWDKRPKFPCNAAVCNNHQLHHSYNSAAYSGKKYSLTFRLVLAGTAHHLKWINALVDEITISLCEP